MRKEKKKKNCIGHHGNENSEKSLSISPHSSSPVKYIKSGWGFLCKDLESSSYTNKWRRNKKKNTKEEGHRI